MSNALAPANSNASNKITGQKSQPSYSTFVSSNLTPQFVGNTNTKSRPKPSLGSTSSFRLSRTNTSATDAYLSSTTQDAQSSVTIDKIPSAKPSVTYLDKLWTQIDVLDDVKRMADEVRAKGSFFDERFTKEMEKLKILQDKLYKLLSLPQFDSLQAKETQNQQLYQLNTNVLLSPVVSQPGTPPLQKPSGVPLARGATNESNQTTPLLDGKSNDLEDEQQQQTQEGQGCASENADEVNAKLKLEEENNKKKKKRQQEKINEFFANDEIKFENLGVYNKATFDEISGYVQQVKQDLLGLGDAIKTFDESTKDIW